MIWLIYWWMMASSIFLSLLKTGKLMKVVYSYFFQEIPIRSCIWLQKIWQLYVPLVVVLSLTSKFDWTLDDIRIEKIISDIVPSCNPVQCQGKLTMQTWENDENANIGPKLGIVPSYHPMQFKGTLMNQTLAQIWAAEILFVGFTSTRR